MLDAWLLLVIAGLVLACLSLYFHAQRMESDSLIHRSMVEEELRLVERALEVAQGQVHSQPIFPPAFPLAISAPEEKQREQLEIIFRLRRSGVSLAQIARDLDLPLGAVETLISLER